MDFCDKQNIYIYVDLIDLVLLQNYINRQSYTKSNNKVYLDSYKLDIIQSCIKSIQSLF